MVFFKNIKLKNNIYSLLTSLLLLISLDVSAKSSGEIDAAIDSAIDRFTNEIQGAQTYLDGARGILVIPK
jgi:hypothetical protein